MTLIVITLSYIFFFCDWVEIMFNNWDFFLQWHVACISIVCVIHTKKLNLTLCLSKVIFILKLCCFPYFCTQVWLLKIVGPISRVKLLKHFRQLSWQHKMNHLACYFNSCRCSTWVSNSNPYEGHIVKGKYSTALLFPLWKNIKK